VGEGPDSVNKIFAALRGRPGAHIAMMMALAFGCCATVSPERIVAAMLMFLLRKQTTAESPRI